MTGVMNQYKTVEGSATEGILYHSQQIGLAWHLSICFQLLHARGVFWKTITKPLSLIADSV